MIVGFSSPYEKSPEFFLSFESIFVLQQGLAFLKTGLGKVGIGVRISASLFNYVFFLAREVGTV